MLRSNLRPKWWQLYLTLPFLIALFVVDSRLKISTRGHQVVQIAIILLVYGLIQLWLKSNATALSGFDLEQEHPGIRVFRIPPSQLPESNAGSRQLLQFPDSELSGVLSDTFEMDIIDAEFYPVDEVHQESKKE
jgi:hypothetical protein